MSFFNTVREDTVVYPSIMCGACPRRTGKPVYFPWAPTECSRQIFKPKAYDIPHKTDLIISWHKRISILFSLSCSAPIQWWPKAFFSKSMLVACKIFSGWLTYTTESVVISLPGRMVMRQEQIYSLLTRCFAISTCCFTTTQSSTLTGHITTQTYVGIQLSLMMQFPFDEFLHIGNVNCLVSRLHFLVAMALLGHGKFTNHISETNTDGPLRRTENTTVSHTMPFIMT